MAQNTGYQLCAGEMWVLRNETNLRGMKRRSGQNRIATFPEMSFNSSDERYFGPRNNEVDLVALCKLHQLRKVCDLNFYVGYILDPVRSASIT